MIPTYNKNIFLLPVCDGGLTKPFAAKTHLGCDFGWYDTQYCKVLSIQDGKVIDIFESTQMGNCIVIEHEYDDGTHRWSGYIHLKNPPTLKIGDPVKRGQAIGIRGNTGTESRGVHLHIYVSDITTKKYSWNTLKSLCTFDPFHMFYKSHAFTYTLATLDKYHMNEIKYMDDEQSEVERLKAELNKLQLELDNEKATNMILQAKLDDITKIIKDI